VIKNITCYKGSDGKVTLNPAGGTSPYQFSTDGSVYTGVSVYSNLTAGNYTFYIKDSRNCTYDTTVTVFQSTLMTNVFTVRSVSCFSSNDGELSVVTSGGSKPYKYAFNGGAFDTISTFKNLPIGTYTLQTKDTFGCVKDTTVTLTQPPQIFAKAVSTNVLCYNAGNGTIEIAATGGVPPFMYSLDNNAFTAISKYYGLSPATYKVNVRDKLGCIRDTLITITQPDSINFSYTSVDVTCYGGDDGRLVIHVSGGTAPYLYSFEARAYQSDTLFTNLKAGTSRTITIVLFHER
jgi:hypothetical protein